MSKFNIVLVEPEIPQNTGAIGRLCVSTDTTLHLVKPLGFSLEDKFLKRAGMDYWKHLKLKVYENWNEFVEKNQEANMLYFTTKTQKTYWDCEYPEGVFLIFGSESKGLAKAIHENESNMFCTIPMSGEFHRSLNLANSAAVALYEAMRVNRKVM